MDILEAIILSTTSGKTALSSSYKTDTSDGLMELAAW